MALTNISPERAAELLQVALSDPWLLAETTGHRFMPVEVIDVGDGKSGIQVRFVDYTGLRTLSIGFSALGAVVDRRIGEIGVANYSNVERAEASALALSDPDVLSRSNGTQLVVNNITGASGPGCAGTRCLVVFLTPPDGDHAGLLIVTVDLAARRVVAIDERR